jgi:thiamine biosynthesis lipoprotein ApbE
MDVTVGPLVNLWGFGPNKQPVTTPDQAAIDDARPNRFAAFDGINQYGQQYLQKDIPDLFVDLSTVGEGYAADHLAALMTQEGISRYLVSVGGALVSRGMNATGKAWRVAIQNRPISKTPCRRLWISTAMGSVHPAATVTITSWTANAFHMLSIRKRVVRSSTIWCP